MKTASFLLPLCLAAAVVNAQTLKEIADSLPVPPLQPGATAIPVPQVEGVTISLFSIDYEQVVDKNGKLLPGQSDTPIQVAYRVERDGVASISKDYTLIVPGAQAVEGANPKPHVIPEILQWKGDKGTCTISDTIGVHHADHPEKAPCAQALLEDIKDLLGKDMKISNAGPGEWPEGTISLLLSPAAPESPGMEEAYWINITRTGICIGAYTEKGLYWGTRTLLQMLKQGDGTAPCGIVYDVPRYKLRGFMLDIARLPIPMDVLKDVVRTMAWYKMNDLHLVINNNFIFHEQYVDAGRDPFKESYTAFRLESKVKGADGTPLTAQDLHYTKEEFMQLIDFAKAHGVNIVPEIDAPGHALSFTRVRPDLMYQGPMHNAKRRCEMLDASNPEAIKFIGGVMDEYLLPEKEGARPVFKDCVMHVGADEFYGDKEAYRAYMDGILRHVLDCGYTPRVWGSLHQKPGKTPVVAKGVQMNLWSGGWAKAWESVQQGYDVINTNDGALYIVPYANYYRMDKCHEWVYDHFTPKRIGNETLPAGHPQLLGATFGIWHDMTDLRYNGYCIYDIWDALTASMHIVSQKTWGLEQTPCSFQEHCDAAKAIGGAPGCNPFHLWKDATPVSVQPQSVPMEIGKPDLGPAYHAVIELELTSRTDGQEQVLLSGPQGEFLACMKDGTVGFRRADTIEFSFDYKLPVDKKVKLEIIGTPGKTSVMEDGKDLGAPRIKSFHNIDSDVVDTLILPMQSLGKSLHGMVYSITVTPSAQ